MQVVKHDHRPKETTKFLGAAQTSYAKKNWSSVMLFDNARCGALTPDYVNAASGLELHQFKWLESYAMIGELPHRWNYLVGYDAPSEDISLAHYTIGGPYFPEYANCPLADDWRAEATLRFYGFAAYRAARRGERATGAENWLAGPAPTTRAAPGPRRRRCLGQHAA